MFFFFLTVIHKGIFSATVPLTLIQVLANSSFNLNSGLVSTALLVCSKCVFCVLGKFYMSKASWCIIGHKWCYKKYFVV